MLYQLSYTRNLWPPIEEGVDWQGGVIGSPPRWSAAMSDEFLPDQKDPNAKPMSLLVLIGFGILALFCCCSGSVSTLVFGMESESAGTAAAMISGPAIGFGLGGLIGATASHFVFKDKGDDMKFRIGIPVAGAFVGAMGIGLITVLFFAVIFPAL
jgi:hypothetical protein